MKKIKFNYKFSLEEVLFIKICTDYYIYQLFKKRKRLKRQDKIDDINDKICNAIKIQGKHSRKIINYFHLMDKYFCRNKIEYKEPNI